ncbi:pentapeptide repeat-containing protein [[Scytonema hofmanni] UTEX B 1581]|nr:pentapeptide repeat-containing protein [[Scytonema hofmanni] UTEX B 1581]
MANEEHLKVLKQGIQAWNQWRKNNPEVNPDFTQADLTGMGLAGAYLSDGDFVGAKLDEADLSGAELMWASLSGASIRGTDLSEADLTQANLISVNLERAKLSKANLRIADLQRSRLEGVDLVDANLSGANLNEADLSGANLSGANLSKVQALGTNLTKSILTGSCIEDWNINTRTKLNDIDCLYVYRKADERYPSSGDFAPDEFTKLFQKSLSFIDLIFRNGVDWKAFALTFEKVKYQNKQADLAVQSIENRGDGILIIRINVSPDVDKSQVYNDFIQGYEFARKVLEERYRAELSSKDIQIIRYNAEVQRQQEYINSLFYLLNQTSEKLGEVPKIMAEQSPKVQQTLTGTFYGVAGNVEGNQNINVSSHQSLAEALELIKSLREIAQDFPEVQREEVLVHLDDLEEDINQPEKRQPQRLRTRLMTLLSIAAIVGGAVATATDFTNNIFELSEKLGIPIPVEVSQPQTLKQPPRSGTQ